MKNYEKEMLSEAIQTALIYSYRSVILTKIIIALLVIILVLIAYLFLIK